jgi:hypothetical protein
MTTPGEIRRQALAILESHWDAALQATLPHPLQYPHRWLWDSCFHAIAWAALGRPEGLVELGSVLGSALPTVLGRGFLPHMVYGDPDRTGGGVDRGPLAGMSSFTQPAVHALALSEIGERGFEPPPWMHRASADALAWLWGARLRDGLLTIAHPWESGQDISPRFDAWYDDPGFSSFGEHYAKLVRTASYDAVGVAVSNSSGVVAPAGFNAIAADAAARLPASPELRAWGQELARQIDRQLWNPEEDLWDDRPDEAHRPAWPCATLPTLDGVLGALATQSRPRAERALRQCVGDGRFAAPFGPRFLPAGHPEYQPDVYWRGPAWPQLNYLLVVAARRHGLADIASELTETTLRGVVASGFSEFWHPETGEARGATPQSWATVAVALLAPVEATF